MGHGISEGDIDLFGQPLLPERGKGRPAHVWSLENSNKVNLLFAAGKTPKEVAKVLRVSYPTFRKHYFNEIAASPYAPDLLLSTQLARLNKAAEGGNVTAERALAGMIQAERVKAAAARIIDRGKTEARPEAMGKKEAAKQAAKQMSGKFGARTPPPLLIQ